MEQKIKICKGTGRAEGNGCGTEKYLHKYGLCLSCFIEWLYNTQEGKKILKGTSSHKKKKQKKKPLQGRKQKINLADRYFSRYIRLKYSHEGKCKCATCSANYEIRFMDNGHFISRGNFSTRYQEDNCRPQCKKCNYYKHGEHAKFRDKLIEEIGIDRVEQLEQLGRKSEKLTNDQLDEIIETYRNKYKEIENKLNIKIF